MDFPKEQDCQDCENSSPFDSLGFGVEHVDTSYTMRLARLASVILTAELVIYSFDIRDSILGKSW